MWLTGREHPGSARQLHGQRSRHAVVNVLLDDRPTALLGEHPAVLELPG
jgi:hypothetical protein